MTPPYNAANNPFFNPYRDKKNTYTPYKVTNTPSTTEVNPTDNTPATKGKPIEVNPKPSIFATEPTKQSNQPNITAAQSTTDNNMQKITTETKDPFNFDNSYEGFGLVRSQPSPLSTANTGNNPNQNENQNNNSNNGQQNQAPVGTGTVLAYNPTQESSQAQQSSIIPMNNNVKRADITPEDEKKMQQAFNPDTSTKNDAVQAESTVEKGSLADIEKGKQDIVDSKKDSAVEKLTKNSKKYQEYYNQLKELQKDPTKNADAIADIQDKKTKMENAAATKLASKDENYKKLSSEQKKEEAALNKLGNNFNLVDKDGNKIEAKDLKGKKLSDFVDEDGNIDRSKLEKEVGVKTSYNKNAIRNNPQQVLNDPNATEAEKDLAENAQMAAEFRAMMSGAQGGYGQQSYVNSGMSNFTSGILNLTNQISAYKNPYGIV